MFAYFLTPSAESKLGSRGAGFSRVSKRREVQSLVVGASGNPFDIGDGLVTLSKV